MSCTFTMPLSKDTCAYGDEVRWFLIEEAADRGEIEVHQLAS